MIFKVLGLILATLLTALAQILSSRDCSFIIANREYDLCPLFSLEGSDWKVEVDTPPTVAKAVYRIGLGWPLGNDGLSKKQQCPDGTWVCMTVYTRSQLDSPQTIQSIPVADGRSFSAEVLSKVDDDGILLRMEGEKYQQQRQEVHFHFICNLDVEEPSAPSFRSSHNGAHTFSWRTPHACTNFVTMKNGTSKHGTSKHGTSKHGTSKHGTSHKKGKNSDSRPDGHLVGHLPTFTVRTFTILAISGILLIGYMIFSPDDQIKQWVRAQIGRSRQSQLPFRVGETMLLRWAEEDIELGEVEEDEMVNYRQDRDTYEQIPLKPSRSNHSGQLTNYGAAKN